MCTTISSLSVVSCRQELCSMAMARTDFGHLRVYQLEENLADFLWPIVLKWQELARNTGGRFYSQGPTQATDN
jgi:hypothetical protein